jgi:hypothetical protein
MMGVEDGAEGGGVPLGRVVVAILEVLLSSEMFRSAVSPVCLAACNIYGFLSSCP